MIKVEVVKRILSHDRFYVRDGIVHLDDTDKPISSDLQERMELESEQTVDDVRDESFNLIKVNHARVLSELSGKATVEERDTWPLQKEWASGFVSAPNDHHKNLLEGLLTPGEKAALGDNAAQFMAEKIISKSHAMDLLTSKAGGLKREAEEALNAADTKDEIQLIMGQLEQKMQVAIQEFMQTLSDG